jgi:hypothetical protein
LSGTLARTVGSALRGSLGAGLAGERREETRSSLIEASVNPGCTAFLGGIRCDAGLVARRLLRSQAASAYDLSFRNSLDWNARLNARRGRHASLSLEYVGRKARGAGAVHSLKASLSATF